VGILPLVGMTLGDPRLEWVRTFHDGLLH